MAALCAAGRARCRLSLSGPFFKLRRVHKIAFELGPLSIHWYGILVAIGFLAGLWTASRRAARSGLPGEIIADLGFWLLLGAIVGARALYVATFWRVQFADKPIWEIFRLRSGFVYYGGLIGATLAGLLFTRGKKIPFWKVADVLAPSIALGHAFGRMGCLMTGCCYGRACDLPWAIHFPADHETKGVGVHPTQVYEALLNLVLYAALAWLYRRKRFDGQVFAAYLVSYAVVRSFVECFRGDYPVRYLGGWATPAHLVSFGVFLAGLALLWKLPRKPGPAD